MSNSFLYPVPSRPTIDFLGALAAAGSTLTGPFVGLTPLASIPGVPAIASRRFLIRAIEYLAPAQFGLEFDFFGSAAGESEVLASDTFISRFQFVSANGSQYNGVGNPNNLWRFYIDGLAIPYYDLDTVNTQTPPTLHVGIQNVDTVAKAAGAPGAVAATFWLEPMQAW